MCLISLKGCLTREYILQYVSEERIFERYLGIWPRMGESFCNPLTSRPKPDRNPGCRFFERYDGKLIFKDYAWEALDCFDCAREYYHMPRQGSFQDVLYRIAQDFGILDAQTGAPLVPAGISGETQVRTVRHREGWVPIQVAPVDWTDQRRAFWQLPDLEVTTNHLTHGGVCAIEAYWFNHYLGESGLTNSYAYQLGYPDKWQIYRPKVRNPAYKFRQSSSSWVVGCSRLTNQGYNLITKSNKDRLGLATLLGYNACNTLTETLRFSPEQIAQIESKGKPILLYDNDTTGLDMMQKRSLELGWDFITYPKSMGGKDTWACLNQPGGVNRVTEFLDEQLDYLGIHH